MERKKKCEVGLGLAVAGFFRILQQRMVHTVNNDDDDEAEEQEPARKLPKSRLYFATVEDMDDREFLSHFRVSRGTLAQIITLVEAARATPWTHGLITHQRVLISLWYLANQEPFRCVSQRFGVSLSTAHAALSEVTHALSADVDKHIRFPTDLDSVARGFSRFGFPNVVGAIDGSHISMTPPALNKGDFISRKHRTAVNLTAVCDATMLFTDVFCGYTGKCHDSRVYNESPLKQRIVGGLIPPQYHLLGDAAYGLGMNIMTPIGERLDTVTPDETATYNNIHSSTRMVIERAFGMLKGRWRRLIHIDNDLENVNPIIMACCVLHNMCITNGDILNIAPVDTFDVIDLDTTSERAKRQGIVDFLNV